MPQIPEYQQQQSVSGTAIPGRNARETDVGGPAMSQLGAGLQASGQDLGRAGRALAEQDARAEVTDVYTRMAGMQAKWSKTLRDRGLTVDPSDEGFVNGAFATQFQTDLKDDLDTLADRYTTPQGRQTFQKQAAELSAHFVEASGVFEAKLAGVRAAASFDTLVNGWQNSLIRDPDGLPSAQEQVNTAINDTSGTYAMIPATEREKLRLTAARALQKSAVEGWIQLSPSFALAKLQEREQLKNLDADDRHTLIREAKTAQHALEVAKDQQALNQIRALKLQDQAATDDWILKAADFKWNAGDIAADPRLLPDTKIQLINLAHARSKEPVEAPIATIPSTELALFNRIHLPTGDPNKLVDPKQVYQAYLAKQLSWDDMNKLRKEIYDAATPDGAKLGARVNDLVGGIKSSITKANPLLGKLDPEGDLQLYKYQSDLQRKVDEYRKTGKDPYDLLDPSKADFFGRPEILSGYQKTLQQSIQDIADKMRAEPGVQKTPEGGSVNEARRQPKETVEQYLERRKKK